MLETKRPIDRVRRATSTVLLALVFSANGAFAGLAAPNTGAEFVDYAQCANGASPSTSTACPEGWINGILNTNNSHYAEDQVTPQRAEVVVPAGGPSTGRTLTFSYQTRKGTIHAYDSLATWNFTQTTANRCQGLSAANCIGGSPSTFPIPADPTVVADTGAGSATALHQLPGQFMTMYGGTITGVSVPSHDNAAGPGDDYATVVVTYSVADTASDRLVQLLFGGHLAPSTGPRGWGLGLGAGSVSGGPYHIKWEAADGASIGNRDNQIMAGAILAPSLAITKTADAASVNAGSPIGFTISVSNSGAGPATDVTVTDALPTGTGISWSESPDNASCSIVANALSCTFASIAVGASASVHVVSPTTGGSCGTYDNTALFSSASGSGQATASVTVNCQPDVTVSKSGNGPLTAGDTATFSVTVSASGTGPSSDVTLSDILPSGTWTLGGTDAASCGIAAGTLSCNFGTMASGTSKVVTLSRATDGGDCPSIANTATVSATGDTDTANNSSSTTIAVNCTPDISIEKSGSTAVSAGGDATFTITVSAGGTGPSSNVTLSDTLPSGTWILGGTDAAACGITAGVLSCSFGTMVQGTSRNVTLSRATNSEDCPAITNTAVVNATGDTNTQNNSSTASVSVNCGQITLGKSADIGTVNAGETIGFIIAVANLGDGTATNVVVTDPLPAGLAWAIDAAASDPGCSITSDVLTCTFGDLAPSESRSVHLTSPTTAENCGTLINTATATTENDGSAEASDSIVVNCQPDVSVAKSGNGPLTSGQTATFTITISAGGTGPSSNVTLTDTLPAGTWTLGGADAASCTLGSSSLTCNFGTMSSGTSKTITLSRASTTGDCSTPIANTAIVNATADSNTQNNSSSASITVNCPPLPQSPQLVVSKAADAAIVTAGAQGTAHVGFTVNLTNNGFIPTTAVLTDLPLVAAGPSTPAGNAGTLGLTWSIDAFNSDTGCSIAGNTLSCNFGTLQPGETRQVHITAPVTGRTSATSRDDNCGQRVDNMATVTIGNGSTRQSNHAIVDIACLPTTSAGSLSIRKYADNNADSLQGAGESNLPGWTFEVRNNATGAVRTVTTGANGSVTVNDLEAGDYTVTEKSCTSPCDLSKWKPISYVISGQIAVSNRSGIAQVTISGLDQTITFGNQPPLLPSTSTDDGNRDRVQTLVLLLLAALVAQVLILRVVARLSLQKGS